MLPLLKRRKRRPRRGLMDHHQERTSPYLTSKAPLAAQSPLLLLDLDLDVPLGRQYRTRCHLSVMRARRALRCLTLNHLFLILFAFSLYVFWRNGFRQRHPEDEEFDSAQDVNGLGTGVGNGRSFRNGSRTRSQDAGRELHIEHPIPKLMEEAEKRFSAKLARQSKTLEDAVVEYRRRYNMEPPLGFDEWWDFAQKYKFKMVDEFDILMEDMAPFYGLPGVEVRRRVDQVSEPIRPCRKSQSGVLSGFLGEHRSVALRVPSVSAHS